MWQFNKSKRADGADGLGGGPGGAKKATRRVAPGGDDAPRGDAKEEELGDAFAGMEHGVDEHGKPNPPPEPQKQQPEATSGGGGGDAASAGDATPPPPFAENEPGAAPALLQVRRAREEGARRDGGDDDDDVGIGRRRRTQTMRTVRRRIDAAGLSFIHPHFARPSLCSR